MFRQTLDRGKVLPYLYSIFPKPSRVRSIAPRALPARLAARVGRPARIFAAREPRSRVSSGINASWTGIRSPPHHHEARIHPHPRHYRPSPQHKHTARQFANSRPAARFAEEASGPGGSRKEQRLTPQTHYATNTSASTATSSPIDHSCSPKSEEYTRNYLYGGDGVAEAGVVLGEVLEDFADGVWARLF